MWTTTLWSNKKIFLLILLWFSIHMLFGQSWSAVLEQKVSSAVKKGYELESFHFVPIETVELTPKSAQSSPEFLADVVDGAGVSHGIVFVSQAPSMKKMFDYIVLFDDSWTVLKAKILVYRENYGRQVGTARWLSQFKGMTPIKTPKLDDNIDGISGATISCAGITEAIEELLLSLGKVELAVH